MYEQLALFCRQDPAAPLLTSAIGAPASTRSTSSAMCLGAGLALSVRGQVGRAGECADNSGAVRGIERTRLEASGHRSELARSHCHGSLRLSSNRFILTSASMGTVSRTSRTLIGM